ncbi:hypothetical protein DFQ26_001621 [Actinomortierella ambigua]|nr:hypothetical protein DFQ26_001621 [Actinomortierella ambigua]
MPTDDAQYQSPGAFVLNGPLPFNLTEPMTGPGGQRIRTEVVQRLREPQGCRMRVSKGKDGQDYPPLQQQNSSRYDFGSTSTRAQDTLVAMIVTIFLREHNTYCARLKSQTPTLSDNDAFEQTRAYIIALFQHFTYTEYLGTILGQTLQALTHFSLQLRSGEISLINMSKPQKKIFAAADNSNSARTRYGHSELSDKYQILDKDDQYLTTLTLRDLRNPRLIEDYGVETIARLCARQTQEEVDIYYSDETRNSINVAGRPFDLAQLDILRSRDHGLPLYNDARKLFGLSPVTSFDQISSNPTIQQTLQSLYGSVDKVETIVGALLETHLPGSNLGPLFWESIYRQFWTIRSSDRFWYNRPNMLEPGVLRAVQSTTLRSFMLGYFRDGTVLPENVWKHMPNMGLERRMGKFQIQFTPTYRLSWVTKSDSITFTMTVTGEVGWVGFGIGPNPNMAGALFYVVDNQDGGLMLQKYVSQGIATIPRRESIIRTLPIPSSGQPLIVSWDHPLSTNGIDISSSKNFYALYAQSNTKQVTYHGTGDARGYYSVNFFTSAVSSGLSNDPVNTHKYHGIGMFICWGLANAINIHRYIQVLTGVSITSLATAAISTSTPGRGQSHKYIGVTILALVVGQVGLGLVVIYSMERIEHANRGLALVIKWVHRIMGSSLLFLAWYNIYLGMVAYPSPQRWIIAYLVYLAAMVIGVCIYHVYWHNTGRVKKGTKAIRVGDFLTPGNKQSLKKLPSSWPKMTWNEINERVLSGAKLVVVDDYVFDIRSWINSHPGGAKVLQRAIGTDITADLYGHYDDDYVINHRRKEKGLLDDGDMELSSMNSLRRSPSLSGSRSFQAGLLASQEFTTNLPKELAYLDHLPPISPSAATPTGAKRLSAFCRGFTTNATADAHARDDPLAEAPSLTDRLVDKLRQLMRYIDRLNTNSTTAIRSSASQPLRRPLTTHTHSIRAISRLATYCIAILDRNMKSDDLGGVGLSTSRRDSMVPFGGLASPSLLTPPPPFTSSSSSSGGHLSTPVTHRKRMSVAVVPMPVIQSNRVFRRYIMTGKATVSSEQAPRPVRRFTFRSVQPWSTSDNPDLRKPFLPGDYVEIQCVAQGQLITRAYTPVEGNMEDFTLLDKKIPGYEVRVRGPFDQAIRQRAKGDYLSGGGGYDSGGEINNNIEEDEFGKPTIQRVLLNPADPERGCWSLLMMVAGGTGVTPMLQLIQYHLHHASTLDRGFAMYLLYLNQSPKDIIAGPYLDTLVEQSNGMLHITYAIKEGVHKMATGCDGVELVGELNTKMLQQWLLTIAKAQRRRSGGSFYPTKPGVDAGRPSFSPPLTPSTIVLEPEVTHLSNLGNMSQPTSPAFPPPHWPSQQSLASRPPPPPPATATEIQQLPQQQGGGGILPPRIPPRIRQQQLGPHEDAEELQYLVPDNDHHPQHYNTGVQSQSTHPPPSSRDSRTVSYADLPSPGLPRSSNDFVGGGGGGNSGTVEYWNVLCRPSSRLVISGPPRMMECASDGLNDLRFPARNRVLMT